MSEDDLESAIARLDAAAREEWGEWAALGRRWTFWIRLSWAAPVPEHLASLHVERWARRMRRRIPEWAGLIGLHLDTNRIHAHGLVYVPPSGAPPNNSPRTFPVGCAMTWHEWHWRRGNIFLERYSPREAEEPTRPSNRAVYYSARFTGTMMRFGSAPEWEPRRKRQRKPA